MTQKHRQGRSLKPRSNDDTSHRQLFLVAEFCLYFTRLRSAINPIATAGERGQGVACSFSPWLREATPKAVPTIGQETFS
jgi:hypothetical protein